MSEIGKRVLTGGAIIGVVVSAVSFDAGSFLALCLLIDVLGLIEFYRLVGLDRDLIRKGLAVLFSVCLLISTNLFLSSRCDWQGFLIIVPIFSSIFIFELYQDAAKPFEKLAYIFLGIVYITIPLVLFYSIPFLIHESSYSWQFSLGYFFLLWANDSGAFAIGKSFGRHALALRISPKKTWEGSIGGAMMVLVFVFLNHSLLSVGKLIDWIIVGVIVIVFGTLGDLVKSTLKRSLGIKDCGNILPGHGGVLDRFDSLIGTAPVVFLYIALTYG